MSPTDFSWSESGKECLQEEGMPLFASNLACLNPTGSGRVFRVGCQGGEG